jgi:hypothetical protein
MLEGKYNKPEVVEEKQQLREMVQKASVDNVDKKLKFTDGKLSF